MTKFEKIRGGAAFALVVVMLLSVRLATFWQVWKAQPSVKQALSDPEERDRLATSFVSVLILLIAFLLFRLWA